MQRDLQLATESGKQLDYPFVRNVQQPDPSSLHSGDSSAVSVPSDSLQERSLVSGKRNLAWRKGPEAYLEIFWEVPAYCIYAQGAIEGSSFSFAYSVSGFNLQIVQVTDPNLNKLMIERPFLINYQEWYWYQQPMQLAATQNVQIPIAFSSIRGIVWGVRRVADLTSNTLGTKQYLMSSELTDIVSLDLRINSQKRQQDVFVGVSEAIPETRRFLPIANISDFYPVSL